MRMPNRIQHIVAFSLRLAMLVAFAGALRAEESVKKDGDAPELQVPQDAAKPAQKTKSAVPS